MIERNDHMETMKRASFVEEVPQGGRPRERLLLFGEKALADHELLAIMLRTGSRTQHVLDLAMRILTNFDTLYEFSQASLTQLQEIQGIGRIKAVEIRAMIELGMRISTARVPKFGKINSTTDVGRWLIQEMQHFHQEHLVALFLNTKNEIIHKKYIFIGTVNSSVAHPREIFKEAVKFPTSRIIIGHNHPSGDPDPSHSDIMFTKRMIECGDLMGIELLDHLIIGENKFISLRETTNIFEGYS